MQQLSEAFRRYQGGTQGSVPVPADAACPQMSLLFSLQLRSARGRSPRQAPLFVRPERMPLSCADEAASPDMVSR